MYRSLPLAALLALLTATGFPDPLTAQGPTLAVRTPMSPPTWALLERQLLRANAAACQEFFRRYFDERGYLCCVERWGGDDGPDDAIENCTDWPTLHALGAPDVVLRLYKKAWEGHLRQYTAARTREVPFARDGMYYKEFPVMFDWLHNGEGLTPFNVQGLSDPYDRLFRQRGRRFAGFYLNEDKGAPNYDPEHKLIRSLFNGSRGPLLRKATALDWAGDPIEVANRFRLGHDERDSKEMLEHFKDYNDIARKWREPFPTGAGPMRPRARIAPSLHPYSCAIQAALACRCGPIPPPPNTPVAWHALGGLCSNHRKSPGFTAGGSACHGGVALGTHCVSRSLEEPRTSLSLTWGPFTGGGGQQPFRLAQQLRQQGVR